MTLIADTGALYAAFDRSDAYHVIVINYLRRVDEKPVVSPLVLAELDHLALVRLGEDARTAVMAELADTVSVATFTHAMFVASADVAARHTGLSLGLIDASVMVLTAAYRLLPFDAER